MTATVEQNALANFLDGLHLARDEASLNAAGARLATDMGFRWFSYCRQTDAGVEFTTSYPRVWITRYFARDYTSIDPVFSNMRKGAGQLTWMRRDMTQSIDLRRFSEDAAAYDIFGGVTIPIRSGFGNLAAFTVSGSSEFASDQPSPQMLDSLGAAALYFHVHSETKLPRGYMPPTDTRLTLRERQCLAWASKGKTMQETADILGVEHRTVCHHVARAKLKLGASSLTHATTLAIKFGEISL